MLSAYDHRLVLFYLSNAVSHLRYRAEAAKDLARWLMDHKKELKFRYPQTPDSVTAVVMWHGSPLLKEEPSREWQHLAETLQNEFAAARQARPDRTAKRLRQLARAVGLTRIDAAILELMLRYLAVPFVESMVDFIFSSTMTSNNIRLRVGNPIFPCLLGVSPGAVHRRFAPDAPLVTSGLVSIDDEGQVSLISQLARLHWLPKVAGSDVRRLLLGEAGPTELRWSDFDHVAGDRDCLERILNGALRTGQKGVNVLVYGPPGTGKTEFCKTLAARLKAPLYVVGESDSEGGEPGGGERLQELRFAQRLLAGDHRSILLFDEMEDLLSMEGGALAALSGWHRGPEFSAAGSKVFMNRLLEKTPVPILWTSNADRWASPALLRRMMFALELRQPPAKVRARVWARQLAHHSIESTEEDPRALAREFDVTPGVASAAKLAGGTITDVRRGLQGLARLLSGNTPPAQGTPDKYDPALIRADVDPVQLADRVTSSGARHFSLCLQGPTGTGKSAFVRYLADRLGLEVMQKRASDLLSKWVGESERNIAKAFAEARDAESFLVFDEADSLLADRRLAVRSWEVSQVNEMLTWMESHPFPFAATTNFRERLDPATLRRFTFKIALGYLSPEQARVAFRTYFGNEPPAEVASLAALTPGDFEVVRRKTEILDCLSDPCALMGMLHAECEAKPNWSRRVGFQ